MKQNIYVIHDLVAKTYTTPFFMHNDQEAKRTFISWSENPELPMHKHLQDYSLYHIGYYDTDLGTIESCGIPNLILKGSSMQNDTPKLEAVGED